MGTENVEVDEQIVDVDTADGSMAVLMKQPVAPGRYPAVVMFHDAPGMRAATHVFARSLAGAGYRVAVPDLYHRHGRMIGYSPEDLVNNPDATTHFRSMLASLEDDEIQRDLDATLGSLGDRSGPMACIGFCVGARAVFRTMQRLPEIFVAGAMWHPTYLVDDANDSPHLSASTLQGSLYIGQGQLDEVASVEKNQPFFDAVSTRSDETVIDIHPTADHGFTWSDSPKFDESAASASWDQTMRLFGSLNPG